MKFWDTSALVPLIIRQPASLALRPLFEEDTERVFWWGTHVECSSAIARLEREGLEPSQVAAALTAMSEILVAGIEIQASESVRFTAMRLLRVHPLRAADALQLAAAIQAAENHPRSMDFVCADAKLALAASKEGFRLRGG